MVGSRRQSNRREAAGRRIDVRMVYITGQDASLMLVLEAKAQGNLDLPPRQRYLEEE